MKKLLPVLLSACVAGCIAPPPRPLPPPVDFSRLPPDPQCSSPRQCEVMMAEAAEWLPRLSGMKIQIASANLIETYNPLSYGSMRGRAQLVPINPEASVIRTSFECYRYSDCDQDKFDALKKLRDLMSAAGDMYEATAKMPIKKK